MSLPLSTAHKSPPPHEIIFYTFQRERENKKSKWIDIVKTGREILH